MSISRTAIAEGAVRRPLLSRFTPKAAQRRLESVCGESFSSPILRFVRLSFNACIRGLPPCLWGFGSAIGCKPCAGVGAGLDNPARIGANAADLCKNVLRFMACAPGIRITQSGVRKLHGTERVCDAEVDERGNPPIQSRDRKIYTLGIAAEAVAPAVLRAVKLPKTLGGSPRLAES